MALRWETQINYDNGSVEWKRSAWVSTRVKKNEILRCHFVDRQTDRTSIAGVQSAVTGYTANPNKPTSITLPSISYLDSGKGIWSFVTFEQRSNKRVTCQQTERHLMLYKRSETDIKFSSYSYVTTLPTDTRPVCSRAALYMGHKRAGRTYNTVPGGLLKQQTDNGQFVQN